ncbi:MAG: hypothetical protein K1X88_11490 [Nannocystaceae bacterium]|nr:hypothetical protein [Nannocystaceae bacterium]
MPSLLPPTVIEGFHREDYRADDPQWLSAARTAAVGQHVKLQLRFARPLPTRSEAEPSSWCVLRGVVEARLGDERLRVRMSATSDGTPLAFDGVELEAVLIRDDRFDNPWQLAQLFRVEALADPTAHGPIDFAAHTQWIRVHVTGASADAYLAGVAAGLDTLASAGLPGLDAPPRGVALAHTLLVRLGDIRGWRTQLLLFAVPPAVGVTWTAAADGVLEVDGGLGDATPTVPRVAVGLEDCGPMVGLRGLVKAVLSPRAAGRHPNRR